MPMNVIIFGFVDISEDFHVLVNEIWSLLWASLLCNRIKFFAQNCVFVKNISKIVSKKIIGGYSPWLLF